MEWKNELLFYSFRWKSQMELPCPLTVSNLQLWYQIEVPRIWKLHPSVNAINVMIDEARGKYVILITQSDGQGTDGIREIDRSMEKWFGDSSKLIEVIPLNRSR